MATALFTAGGDLLLGAKVVTIKAGCKRLGRLQAIPPSVIGWMLYRNMPSALFWRAADKLLLFYSKQGA
jgi:hypothetical protein